MLFVHVGEFSTYHFCTRSVELQVGPAGTSSTAQHTPAAVRSGCALPGQRVLLFRPYLSAHPARQKLVGDRQLAVEPWPSCCALRLLLHTGPARRVWTHRAAAGAAYYHASKHMPRTVSPKPTAARPSSLVCAGAKCHMATCSCGVSCIRTECCTIYVSICAAVSSSIQERSIHLHFCHWSLSSDTRSGHHH